MECTYCISAAKYFWKIVFLLPTNQLQSLGVARVYLQMEQSAKYSISIRRFTHTPQSSEFDYSYFDVLQSLGAQDYLLLLRIS